MTSNTRLMGPLGVNETPLDYFISGTIASSIVSGGLNYKKVKQGEMTKNEAIEDTVKISSQAGIASGSAIASVQYLANKNYLGAALSIAVGVGSILAIEKVCQKTKELQKS